jgi:hypothetical protein
MINIKEIRLGNYLLQKINTRICIITCSLSHLAELSKNNQNFYPVVLKPELLEKCGFEENKDYALLPEAREFLLTLPVIGNNRNEICAYIKNNGECFGRAAVNGMPVSNNFIHLHQLQNLFNALTGKELEVNL